MNPEQELQLLEQLLEELLRGIQDTLQNGEALSDEFQGLLAQELTNTTDRIDALTQELQQQQQPPENIPTGNGGLGNAPTASQQLMWILAGQREDTFLQYLQTFPDPELQQLLRNPNELERVIRFLHEMMPSGQPAVSEEGIPHAEINSSNIYGFQYDPSNKKLLVKFQGNDGSGQGPVYSYDNVPPNVYKAFENGAVPAKTHGRNQWGTWWIGKIPSLGSAFHSLIKNGGYAYTRVS